MTEIQKITLRDVLRQKGLHERRIDDIMLLLRFKPERVQMAFYYVAQGMTHEYAAMMIGVTKKQAWKYVHHNCSDIQHYLIEPVYQ